MEYLNHNPNITFAEYQKKTAEVWFMFNENRLKTVPLQKYGYRLDRNGSERMRSLAEVVKEFGVLPVILSLEQLYDNSQDSPIHKKIKIDIAAISDAYR